MGKRTVYKFYNERPGVYKSARLGKAAEKLTGCQTCTILKLDKKKGIRLSKTAKELNVSEHRISIILSQNNARPSRKTNAPKCTRNIYKSNC